MNKIVLPIRQVGWDLVGADGVLLLGGIWETEEDKDGVSAEANKIVVAVNTHDALVGALEKIAAIQVFYTIDNQSQIEEAVDIATKALSAAKGGA